MTLNGLCGLTARSTAELIAEMVDPRRFTEGGFAGFNGSAPLPSSSGEGGGQPVRHRFNPGGNRRVNAVVHHMAITHLRWEPRGRQLYDNARQRELTNSEAMRVLKRKLSDVVDQPTICDITARTSTPLMTRASDVDSARCVDTHSTPGVATLARRSASDEVAMGSVMVAWRS
jgi:transposase